MMWMILQWMHAALTADEARAWPQKQKLEASSRIRMDAASNGSPRPGAKKSGKGDREPPRTPCAACGAVRSGIRLLDQECSISESQRGNNHLLTISLTPHRARNLFGLSRSDPLAKGVDSSRRHGCYRDARNSAPGWEAINRPN